MENTTFKDQQNLLPLEASFSPDSVYLNLICAWHTKLTE